MYSSCMQNPELEAAGLAVGNVQARLQHRHLDELAGTVLGHPLSHTQSDPSKSTTSSDCCNCLTPGFQHDLNRFYNNWVSDKCTGIRAAQLRCFTECCLTVLVLLLRLNLLNARMLCQLAAPAQPIAASLFLDDLANRPSSYATIELSPEPSRASRRDGSRLRERTSC